MRRKWVAIKAVLKKDRVESIQKRLESAKSMLNLAISCVSLQLQIEMKKSSSALVQLALDSGRNIENLAKDGSEELPLSYRSEIQARTTKPLPSDTRINYQKSLEVTSVKRQWVGIGWYVNRRLMGRSRPLVKGDVSKLTHGSRLHQKIERAFLPMNFLGIKGFSMGSCKILGNWQYTFRTIRVAPDDASVFKSCAAGSIDGVREEIESGRATLFDISSVEIRVHSGTRWKDTET